MKHNATEVATIQTFPEEIQGHGVHWTDKKTKAQFDNKPCPLLQSLSVWRSDFYVVFSQICLTCQSWLQISIVYF